MGTFDARATDELSLLPDRRHIGKCVTGRVIVARNRDLPGGNELIAVTEIRGKSDDRHHDVRLVVRLVRLVA